MSNVALPIAGSRPALAPAPPSAQPSPRAWQEAEFSFSDIIDILNPLQHIPLLNRMYREITGDTIGTAAKIAGGTLFGGAVGLVASLVDNVIEETTGKGPGEHLMAFLNTTPDADDDKSAESEGTDVAEITGQSGPRDLDLAYDVGGRFGLRIAMAENLSDSLTNDAGPQLAATEDVPPQSAPQAAPRSAQMPPPQVLAANPDLIADAREQGAKTESWMRLMRAAGENNGRGAPALASATIARAMASYGAAGGGMPLADIARATKH